VQSVNTKRAVCSDKMHRHFLLGQERATNAATDLLHLLVQSRVGVLIFSNPETPISKNIVLGTDSSLAVMSSVKVMVVGSCVSDSYNKILWLFLVGPQIFIGNPGFPKNPANNHRIGL